MEINITLLFEFFIYIVTFFLLSNTLFGSIQNILDNRKTNQMFQKCKIENLNIDINIHKKYMSKKNDFLLLRTNKQFSLICKNAKNKTLLRYKYLQKKSNIENTKIFQSIEKKSIFIQHSLKSNLNTFFLYIYDHLY